MTEIEKIEVDVKFVLEKTIAAGNVFDYRDAVINVDPELQDKFMSVYNSKEYIDTATYYARRKVEDEDNEKAEQIKSLENKLFDMAMNGDRKAIEFFLECQGKAYGWVKAKNLPDSFSLNMKRGEDVLEITASGDGIKHIDLVDRHIKKESENPSLTNKKFLILKIK